MSFGSFLPQFRKCQEAFLNVTKYLCLQIVKKKDIHNLTLLE